MMPLNLAPSNEELIIKKIGGSIMVVSELNGNIIVKVKESRIALDNELARKIMV